MYFIGEVKEIYIIKAKFSVCLTMRSTGHLLKKTSSMQLKRRDHITRDYNVRQTEKLAFIVIHHDE